MKPVVGIVVSNKMQKSVVVAVDRLFHHKVYNRYVKRTSKFMAHDEADACNIGDRVGNPSQPPIDPSRALPSVSDFVCPRITICVSIILERFRYWILLLRPGSWD